MHCVQLFGTPTELSALRVAQWAQCSLSAVVLPVRMYVLALHEVKISTLSYLRACVNMPDIHQMMFLHMQFRRPLLLFDD